MCVESLRPHDFGKVSFVSVKFGPANQESFGDIRMVSNCLFSVSSYILVLTFGIFTGLQNLKSAMRFGQFTVKTEGENPIVFFPSFWL